MFEYPLVWTVAEYIISQHKYIKVERLLRHLPQCHIMYLMSIAQPAIW